MPIPELTREGYLPPGIYAATLRETLARFGVGSEARQQKGELLRLVVESAQSYPTIKRVLIWGSFVTAKPEPRDLDYSIIVDVMHHLTPIPEQHRRFLVPSEVRRFYGADVNYVVVIDYPLNLYLERVDFLCQRRDRKPSGIVEISLRDELGADTEGEHYDC